MAVSILLFVSQRVPSEIGFGKVKPGRGRKREREMEERREKRGHTKGEERKMEVERCKGGR